MCVAVALLSRGDGGPDCGEQLQSLYRVQGSHWNIQLQLQHHRTGYHNTNTHHTPIWPGQKY